MLHEQMHIQYKDYIWKLLSFTIMSIHWFNPILWVMYKVFQGELEKPVMKELSEDLERKRKRIIQYIRVSCRYIITPVQKQRRK